MLGLNVMFLYTPFTFECKRCFKVFLLMKFKRQNSQSHCCNLKLAIAATFDENWNSDATKIKLSFWAFNNIIGSPYYTEKIFYHFLIYMHLLSEKHISLLKFLYVNTAFNHIAQNPKIIFCVWKHFNDFFTF